MERTPGHFQADDPQLPALDVNMPGRRVSSDFGIRPAIFFFS
jgi:hypothetical protein